jgi:Zn-finger nucleic acid-binding protein
MHLAAGSDYLTCAFCKSVHLVDADDEGVRTIDEDAQSCPICDVPLWNATLSGVRLRSCKKCKGILIPMEVFPDLLEQLRAKQTAVAMPAVGADSSELRRKINCPNCHKPMDTHFYFGGGRVVIDGCDPCCLNWLDHGELMRIVRAPNYSQPDLADPVEGPGN